MSHHVDYDVGLSIIDRFTYYLLEFCQGIGPGSKATMQDLINHMRYRRAQCHNSMQSCLLQFAKHVQWALPLSSVA